jgi:hypothetical protein
MHIYIAPNGSDSNDGTESSPLASLDGARDMIRRLKSDVPTDFRVLLRGGTYRITDTVAFGLSDGADDGQTVTYANYPGETPVLSAGVPVGPWRRLPVGEEPEHLSQEARGHLWTADIPQAAGRPLSPRSLFAGPRRLTRARGESFAPEPDTADVDEESRRTSIHIAKGAVEDWPDLKSAEVLVIPNHSWTMNYLPIAGLKQDGTELVTSQPHTYPMVPSAPAKGPVPQASAYIENSLAVLSEPGEWVADPEKGLLYYWPEAGEPEPDIVVPALTEMIRVEGDIDYAGAVDTPVRGLGFEGLTMMHGDRYPWHGKTGWGIQHDWEAFDRPTALVRFRGAEDCRVQGCEIHATAGAAIRCDLHCRNIEINRNHIHDIGGVGVLLCGYGPGTKDVNRNNAVLNNHIHHVGRVTWHAPAIFVWQSGRNHIAHNLLHHTPYTAVVISGRMRWDREGIAECSKTIRWHETASVVGSDYEQQPWFDAWYPDWKRREPLYHGRRNILEYNDIHDVMETMGDGNGVYISGAGGGNVVRFNRIHDCPSEFMYEAIRCDDDQHGTLIHGNLIYHLGGAAIGIANKGINDITNNIIACPISAVTKRAMISLEMDRLYGVKVQRNIIYTTLPGQVFVYEGRPLHGDGRDSDLRDCEADRNIYWCTAAAARCSDFLLAQRSTGVELHSLAVDPQFVDPDAADFRLRPESPAYGLGFEPIDLDRIGPTAH